MNESRRFKITVEYDGTNFYGWQKQNSLRSIQETIEQAIHAFSSQKVLVYGSGRTDAGVHATGQVAHFDLCSQLSAQKIFFALNHFLKFDKIAVVKIEEVTQEFHARFSAKMREYEYFILNRTAPSALMQNRVWHYKNKLDIEKMQDAAKVLIGHHDFTSFRSVKCQAKSPVKTVSSIVVSSLSEDLIKITVTAPSFLQNQVRIIVGSLAEAGIHNITADQLRLILIAKDRTQAPLTAPACGLYLSKVSY